ncbi:hypothetical protein [Burkholderia glumae]
MPRKPVSELKGGRGSRQIVWEFIRAHADSFTVFDIEKATRLDLATIRTYVQWLERGGFVAVTNDTRTSRQRKQYRLVRNVGIEAPRIDKAGKLLAPTGQENMWRTMRITKTFTAEELAARSTTDQTSVSVASARNYITDLARAAYLLVVDPGHPYRPGVGAKRPCMNASLCASFQVFRLRQNGLQLCIRPCCSRRSAAGPYEIR